MTETAPKSRDGYKLDDFVVSDGEESDGISSSDGLSIDGAENDLDHDIGLKIDQDEKQALKEAEDVDSEHITKPRKSKEEAAAYIKILNEDDSSSSLSDDEQKIENFQELPFSGNEQMAQDFQTLPFSDDEQTGQDLQEPQSSDTSDKPVMAERTWNGLTLDRKFPCQCMSKVYCYRCKYDKDISELDGSSSSITADSPKTPKSSGSSINRTPLSAGSNGDKESRYDALMKAFIKSRVSPETEAVPQNVEQLEYKYGEPLDNSPFACRKRYLPYDTDMHRNANDRAKDGSVKRAKHSHEEK